MTQLSRRFDDALTYASRLHSSQVRKGTAIPYLAHLMSVAALVLEDGGSEDEAIAALLHDAVEDQGGKPTLEAIRRRFGDRVADIVAGCSDTDVQPKPPWRARKQLYLTHLGEAAPEVLRVSLADKVHNSRALLFDLRQHGNALWTRFNAAKEDQLWYYRSLVREFSRLRPGPLTEEFARTVSELEDLASEEREGSD